MSRASVFILLINAENKSDDNFIVHAQISIEISGFDQKPRIPYIPPWADVQESVFSRRSEEFDWKYNELELLLRKKRNTRTPMYKNTRRSMVRNAFAHQTTTTLKTGSIVAVGQELQDDVFCPGTRTPRRFATECERHGIKIGQPYVVHIVWLHK